MAVACPSGPVAGALAWPPWSSARCSLPARCARGGYASWPGLIGGVICAAVGIAATRPLLARVRGRLDAEAAGALPLFAEGTAIIAAALSVLLPPVGLIVLLLLLWLLFAGRGRERAEVRRPAHPPLAISSNPRTPT